MDFMRIGIDARFFGPGEKGLGVYAQKLVENLEKVSQETDHQFFIFLTKERFNEFQPKNKNFHKVLADFKWYSWAEQLIYPFFLKKYDLDLMHFAHFNVPIFYRGKFVVTIHDLILFHFPTFKNSTLNKFYYLIKLFAYRLVIKSAAWRAEKIIAISKFTKKDLIDNLKVFPEKIEVVYQGCNFLSKKSQKNPKTILKKYGIVKPYLLYVGNAYPHKNLERLCQVFSTFQKQNPKANLVLAGGRDYFYQRLIDWVKSEGFKGVQFPGFIEEADLKTVYLESEMVVFPSLYEGFGFPPLEALLAKRPVASSDRTSMPEILENNVEYFDPENSDSILKTIQKAYGNRDRKAKISAEEMNKIKNKFNWEKSARETLNVYESVSKQK